MEKRRVLIAVQDGVVTQVFVENSDTDLEITVLDYDENEVREHQNAGTRVITSERIDSVLEAFAGN